MATLTNQRRFVRARDLQKKKHVEEDKLISVLDTSDQAKRQSEKILPKLKTAQGVRKVKRRFIRQRDLPKNILNEMVAAIQDILPTLRFGMKDSRIYPDIHYLLPEKHDDFPGWAYMVDSFGSRYYMEVEYRDGKPLKTKGEVIVSRTNNTTLLEAMNQEKAEASGMPSAIIEND
jgi:hypothetical protein